MRYCRGMRPDISLVGIGLAANLDMQVANCRFRDPVSGMEYSELEQMWTFHFWNFISDSHSRYQPNYFRFNHHLPCPSNWELHWVRCTINYISRGLQTCHMTVSHDFQLGHMTVYVFYIQWSVL